MWTLFTRAWIRRKMGRYIARAIPASKRLRLRQRGLFIVPSASGWGFVLATVLVWLMGTNYSNNLGLALAYFMFTLFLVSAFHTFANLHGLTLEWQSARSVFAGEQSEVQLELSAGPRARFAVDMWWPQSTRVRVNLAANTSQVATLYVLAASRGQYRPARLHIESRHPVGLWRCWSYLDLSITIFNYPRPIECSALPNSSSDHPDGQHTQSRGGDDFQGLRSHQPSDSLKKVSWKHFAQGRGLLSKHYGQYVDTRTWLDWALLPGLDAEARLSRLTFLALTAEKQQQDYGLRIPGTVIEPSQGTKHLEEVLRALALFDNARTANRGEL